jgi:hypothetical protein
MKKIYIPVIIIVFFSFTMMLAVSCKKEGFFTATSTTNLSQTTIFNDSANAEGFLANIYANVGFSTSPSRFTYTTATSTIPCGGLDAACDEAEISHTYSTTALAFAIGSINGGNVTNDAFNTCYTQIRAVNQLLKNLPVIPVKAANKAQMKAEAVFLRAWYYSILLQHYGGVPIVGDSLYTYTQAISETRSTFANLVNYIVAQCDTAALTLPASQSGLGYGRASKGSCLALISRVLLYAASPLYNNGNASTFGPNNNATPQSLTSNAVLLADIGYPNYDANRWLLAKNAASAVINLGAYQLVTDSNNTLAQYGKESALQYLFTQRYNTEYIFQLMLPVTGANYLETLFNPPSRSGSNGSFPYQGLVDAFPMKNGLSITDPSSDYDPTNPYANRDPRLKASILYDQCLLGIRTPTGAIDGYSPVNIYLTPVSGVLQGGTDAVYQGTPTGYYNNKMVDPGSVAEALQAPASTCIPLMRFAEILLNYAEAANEYGGPTADVYQALTTLRARAGITAGANGLYGLTPSMTQAQMRTAIQLERQIELAYEGDRFFDVRRWLIADQTENIQAGGMEIDRSSTLPNATVTYKPFVVRKHSFTTKMYFWPFPQTEIGKGAGLLQNPGY